MTNSEQEWNNMLFFFTLTRVTIELEKLNSNVLKTICMLIPLDFFAGTGSAISVCFLLKSDLIWMGRKDRSYSC